MTAVGKLAEQYGSVAMIGDGINDAPAMGRATIGIAMGAAGSDTAIEAADIALMADELSKLPWLLKHSRRMLSIIRTNIVLSLAVKAIFVALTLAGHIPVDRHRGGHGRVIARNFQCPQAVSLAPAGSRGIDY